MNGWGYPIDERVNRMERNTVELNFVLGKNRCFGGNGQYRTMT